MGIGLSKANGTAVEVWARVCPERLSKRQFNELCKFVKQGYSTSGKSAATVVYANFMWSYDLPAIVCSTRSMYGTGMVIHKVPWGGYCSYDGDGTSYKALVAHASMIDVANDYQRRYGRQLGMREYTTSLYLSLTSLTLRTQATLLTAFVREFYDYNGKLDAFESLPIPNASFDMDASTMFFV